MKQKVNQGLPEEMKQHFQVLFDLKGEFLKSERSGF